MTPPPSVLIVGNPNVGKSSLFNSMTGARQHTVNAPGTTVELETGTWRTPDGPMEVTDLPGTYSLIARSPDERVVAEAITGADPWAVAIVLVDATAPSRSLYLLAQVADSGVPVVAALALNDLAAGHGHRVDPRALEGLIGVPVVEVDGRHGAGLASLATAVRAVAGTHPRLTGLTPEPLSRRGAAGPREDDRVNAERLFEWVSRVAERFDAVPRRRRTVSDPIDRVLLSPATGIPIFLAVSWGLFELTARATAPLISTVNGFFSGPAASGVGSMLGHLGIGGGWFEGLLVDGVLVGLSTVASFVPVLTLIFVALAALEASGYMARVAVVADRAMGAMGLDGRAVLPLMVGFGCNVPALAATRALPDARQRLLTGLLVPFTSCSARLTVYVVLAQTFYPRDAGTVVFGLNVLSIMLVIGVGLLLKGTALRDVGRGPLAMVMPPYQWPRLGVLVRSTLSRVGDFIRGAGLLIVGALVALWIVAAIPVRGDHAVGEVPAADSLYGAGARAVAPILAPMGLGDWHIAAALTSGVVAKEVTVGALAQSYVVDSAGAPEPGTLGERVKETVTRTSGGHPGAAGLAFMVFVLIYAPCVATSSEQRRLFGWKWASGAIGLHLALGWILATLVFQVGRLL